MLERSEKIRRAPGGVGEHRNIARVRLARDRGVDVVLIGTPEKGITVTPPGFYAEIAEAFGIPYEGKVVGKVLRDNGPKVFQIETTLNTDMFPEQFAFINKREWEWNAKDRATFLGVSKALKMMPVKTARKMFHDIQIGRAHV